MLVVQPLFIAFKLLINVYSQAIDLTVNKIRIVELRAGHYQIHLFRRQMDCI